MLTRRRRQRGQAFVETAICAGFLVILLLGCIGFGTIIQASIRCETAAREGARLGTTGGDNDAIRLGVLGNLSKGGDPNDVEGEVAIGITPPDPADRVFNSNVKVEVWWNYPVAIPLFSLFVHHRMIFARKEMVVTVGL